MLSAEQPGGFWRLFDKVAAPTSRSLSAEDRARRKRVFDAAQALARGDYEPARAVLSEA